jgi:hypothetical protein
VILEGEDYALKVRITQSSLGAGFIGVKIRKGE